MEIVGHLIKSGNSLQCSQAELLCFTYVLYVENKDMEERRKFDMELLKYDNPTEYNRIKFEQFMSDD